MTPPGIPVYDLSAHLAALAADFCRRLPALAQIDPQRVLFAISRSRADGTHGTYARIAPLRFAAGAPEITRRRGRFLETFRMPALVHEGREILYVIYIMVPRFLRLSPEEKLTTVLHELFHVSTSCDGDIRRFAGRNFAHGSSRQAYNRQIKRLLEQYLATATEAVCPELLQLTEEGWHLGTFRLTGLSVPLPRARLVARQRL